MKNTLTYMKLEVLTAELWWFRCLGCDSVWLCLGWWSDGSKDGSECFHLTGSSGP